MANTVDPRTRPSEVPSRTSSNVILPPPGVYSESHPTPSRPGCPRPPFFFCRGCCKRACATGNAPKTRAGCRDKPRTQLGRQRRARCGTRSLKNRAREAARRPMRGPGPLPHPRGLEAVHAGNCSPPGSALWPCGVPCHTRPSASGLHRPSRSLNSPQNPPRRP